MKKFLKQKINFSYVVALLLTMTLGAASVGALAPGDAPAAIIHPGAGAQYLANLAVGGSAACPATLGSECGGWDPSLDARGAFGAVAHFLKTTGSSSSFLVTSASNIGGQIFIGGQAAIGSISSILNLPVGGNQQLDPHIWHREYDLNGFLYTPVLEQVNVLGAVRSTDLEHTSTAAQKLCVTPDGILDLCPNS